jgi:hypothetical protein
LPKGALTAIVIFIDRRFDGARVGLVEGLGGQTVAGGAEAAVVHGMLEGVVLPTEDVVAVLAVAGTGYG